MRRPTALIRIHVPHELVERLDRLARCLSGELGREIPRATLVRAFILIQIDVAESREKLAKALDHDPVTLGRPSALRGGARAALAPSNLTRQGETPLEGQGACSEDP